MSDIKIGAADRVKTGLRGPRGHRGHRGPEGRVPLAGEGKPPFWPPFPNNPPITKTIYANTTGSDKDGKGTQDRPFRTFARAVLNVNPVIAPGYRVIVDITGLGTEILPQDWAMPPITNDGNNFTGADQSFFVFTPLTIRAYPQLALPAGPPSQISAADVGATVTDIGPGLCVITVAASRGSAWAGGILKGLQVVRSSGAFAAACCVFDSTPTQIFLCNTSASFNGGPGSLVLAAGETIDIVTPSAQLLAPPSNRGDALSFTVDGGMNFQGIAMACTVPNAGNGGAEFVGGTQPFFELCNLNEIDILNNGIIQVGLFSTTCSGYVDSWGPSITPRRSYWNGVGSSLGEGIAGNLVGIAQFRQCVFENCLTFGPGAGVAGPVPTTDLAFLNCWFKTSQGDAIGLISPTRLDMTTCQIDGSTGNAITANGPLQATLSAVTGTGNAGFGVITLDGAHVSVDPAVTVGNDTGQAYQNGGELPVATWPGVPFNDVDLAPVATATLSRISGS